MTLTRQEKIDALFNRETRKRIESLLLILAPTEMITWGALNYKQLLAYLQEQIEEEIQSCGKS